MYILAHRGASLDAPANTEEAFKKALDMGADGVEIQVYLTKDKQVVLNHSPSIDNNSNGHGFIKDITLEELKSFDFGFLNGSKSKSTKILTLSEALDILEPAKIINIELKYPDNSCTQLPEIVCNHINTPELLKKVIISSFHYRMLLMARESLPDVKIGLLYDNPPEDPIRLAKKIQANAIYPLYGAISKSQIYDCTKANLDVNIWMVDLPGQARELESYGCNSVITNLPDVLVDALNIGSSSPYNKAHPYN